MGRFLSEDPTGFADGPNPYRYAGNDPVNFSDPTGLSQAGNPLNNLLGGGYSGGRIQNENTALRNPVNPFKPAVSTRDLINSFNGPTRTPSVKDFANVGLTAPSYDPLGASPLPNKFASDVQAYRSAQSNQFFQDLIGPDYSHVSFSNRTPAQRRRDNADIATRTIPGLSDLRDFKEALQGHDQFTNEPISIGQRIVTAGAGFIPFVSGRTLRGLFQTESIDTHTVRDFQISQQHTRQIDVLPNRHVISQIDTYAPPVVPGIAYGELDLLGRPTGVSATLDRSLLRTGTPASQRIIPPGFQGGAAGQSRGHLLGSQLGGSGTDPRNLVAIQQFPANSPVMRGVEDKIAKTVRKGETVNVTITPVYSGPLLMPRGITINAQGNNGFRIGVSVLNPPGAP